MAVPDTGNVTECLNEPGPLDVFLCLQRVAQEDERFKNYSNCASGSIPIPITNTADVDPGYYAPNIDKSQQQTWPQVCPPTQECMMMRLGSQFCPPQGKYEPQLCEPGHFCPDSKHMIECSEGQWCPRGSTKPRKCPIMMDCPPGTQIGTYYGGVVFAVLFDILLIAAFIWMRCYREPWVVRMGGPARRARLLVAARQLKSAANGNGDNRQLASAASANQAETLAAVASTLLAGTDAVISMNPLRAAAYGSGAAATQPPPGAQPQQQNGVVSNPLRALQATSIPQQHRVDSTTEAAASLLSPSIPVVGGDGSASTTLLSDCAAAAVDSFPSAQVPTSAAPGGANVHSPANLYHNNMSSSSGIPLSRSSSWRRQGSAPPRRRSGRSRSRESCFFACLHSMRDCGQSIRHALAGSTTTSCLRLRLAFTPLPAGVEIDTSSTGVGTGKGGGRRVRTKSMRRASGSMEVDLTRDNEDGGTFDFSAAGAGSGRGDGSTLTTMPQSSRRNDRVQSLLHRGAIVGSNTVGGSSSGGDRTPLRRRKSINEVATAITGDIRRRLNSRVQAANGNSSGEGIDADIGSKQLSAGGDPDSSPTQGTERLVSAAATAVLSEGFRRCNAGLALHLEFEGLGLTLPPPLRKTILSSVTGSIVPGRVTAVMGPSGAGKTTFLSVLMGTANRTAGTLKINGAYAEMRAYRSVTGFVPQEDVMLRELTVRENIEHSARVRLPRSGWTDAQVTAHVDAVIQVLGLASCADTPSSRVSGGQRKRTNIGIELAAAPTAIMLDEPTSGLDSTAALEVCKTLKSIADLGLTVVAVIHQPRSEIFASFDDLLLLAPGGRTVYMGPQKGAMRYFVSAGLRFGDADGGAGTPVQSRDNNDDDDALRRDGSSTSTSKANNGGSPIIGINPADALLDFIAGQHPLTVTGADLEAVGMGSSSGSGSFGSGTGYSGAGTGLVAPSPPLSSSTPATPFVPTSSTSVMAPPTGYYGHTQGTTSSTIVMMANHPLMSVATPQQRYQRQSYYPTSTGPVLAFQPASSSPPLESPITTTASTAVSSCDSITSLQQQQDHLQQHHQLPDQEQQLLAPPSESFAFVPMPVGAHDYHSYRHHQQSSSPVQPRLTPQLIPSPCSTAVLATATTGQDGASTDAATTASGGGALYQLPSIQLHAVNSANTTASTSVHVESVNTAPTDAPSRPSQTIATSSLAPQQPSQAAASFLPAPTIVPVNSSSSSSTVSLTLYDSEVAIYLAARWEVEARRAIGKAADSSSGSGTGSGIATASALAAYGLGAVVSGIGGSRAGASTASSVFSNRGASVLSQFLLCHHRSLLQQYRRGTWLALELVVCVAAGGIMGLAATAVDELYSGVLAPPYTLLSPSPMETMLPSLGLYVNMAVGIAGSPAAVRTFGEERDVFLREHGAGHSAFAYFAAKNVATMYRLSLAALHFAGVFTLLARPTSPFHFVLAMTLGIFYGVYGLSMLVSMLVSRENAALMGVIASLIVACMCGFGPNLVQGKEWGIGWVQDLSYSRWANELWVDIETQPYRGLFLVEEVTAAIFGYTLNRSGIDVIAMVAIGTGLRVIAFAALMLVGRMQAGARR